jgi:glycosyltransferase involved in cell wall biosynthesis
MGEVSLFVIGPAHRRSILEGAGYRVAATAEPTARRRSRLGRLIERVAPARAESAWRALSGVRLDYTPDPGLHASLKRALAEKPYDLLVGRYLIPSAQAGLMEPGLPPVIIDIDDVDSKAVAAKIQSPASGTLLRAVLRLRLGEVRRYERSLRARASRLWFSNPDDMALAPGICDLVPNIPFAMRERHTLAPSAADSRTILWVGSFGHRVNLEGVDLFLSRAWEPIRRVCPDARFRIVGSELPEQVRRSWATIPGVDVVGFAESLAPHYAQAAISIVPLLDGAGTKIKVLESLGYMRTCVVTRHSVAGFESLLRDGDSVRIVDSLDELTGPVAELLSQPLLRHGMEERGRAIVERHFTPAAVGDAVRRSLSNFFEANARD